MPNRKNRIFVISRSPCFGMIAYVYNFESGYLKLQMTSKNRYIYILLMHAIYLLPLHFIHLDLEENDDYGYEIKEPTREPTDNIGKKISSSFTNFSYFRSNFFAV